MNDIIIYLLYYVKYKDKQKNLIGESQKGFFVE